MTEITFVFTADGYVTHADGTTDTDPPETEPQDSEAQDSEAQDSEHN